MDPQLLTLLGGPGAAAVLAYLIIKWNREDAKERIEAERGRTADERADKLLLVSVIQDNTRAVSELKGVIERTAHRDRELVSR
jgi:hypothetical protein